MSVNEQSAVPQEIVVPTSLPMILKQFCKAAIRTQPYDLLKWSSSYFRALADGEEPPTKLRLEYPPPCTPSGLTLGFLRVLLRQFGGTISTSHYFTLDTDKSGPLHCDIDYNKLLSVETIFRRWDCLCLDRKELCLIMRIGRFRRRCQVKKFLAIAVGLLGTSLFDTMVMICELFTHDPEGGPAMIPVTLFMEIYGYLAGLKCDGSEKISSEEGESIAGDFSANVDCGAGLRQSVSESNQSLGLVHSMTSQDTDADINLDLELVSKEDPESARSHLGTVLPPSTEEFIKAEPSKNRSVEVASSSSHSTSKTERGKTSPLEEDNLEGRRTSNGHQDSSPRDENKSTKDVKSSDSKDGSQKNESNSDRVSSADRKRGKSDNGRRKHYPNIPGMGPRLSAEQVANVAVWLNECARLQGGMVGPRNLRHIDCPPLDKEDFSNS